MDITWIDRLLLTHIKLNWSNVLLILGGNINYTSIHGMNRLTQKFEYY